MTQNFPVPRVRRIGRLSELPIRIVKGTRRREQLDDLLYSLSWGETTTNNYGFAPAEMVARSDFRCSFTPSCSSC